MKKIIIGVVLVAILGGIGYTLSGYGNKETITVKVTDKERIVTISEGTSSSYYLIYSDQGTYKLDDNLFYGNFRSSDWYGKIKKDSTYTFDLIGYRIGFISSYPEIVSYK
jgi:hypothetical protein